MYAVYLKIELVGGYLLDAEVLGRGGVELIEGQLHVGAGQQFVAGHFHDAQLATALGTPSQLHHLGRLLQDVLHAAALVGVQD